MSDITERIVNLSPAKLALLNRRLQSRAAPAAETIKPREGRGSSAPLSFMQQRLWFLNELRPDSSTYNLRGAVRLAGELDVDAFQRTINEVVARHEALRTRFVTEGQELLQVIDEEQFCPLPVDDLSGLPESELDEATQRLAVAEARQPFDLARGPLLRARLLKLPKEEHVLLFTMHHIVSDAWSMEVLVREVGQLYADLSEGRSPIMPALPIQYADYAVWQRSRLQGEVLESLISYWREQLKDTAPLELPTDYERPTEPDSRSAAEEITLSPQLSERLRELSRQTGSTLFMTLLAAFKLLLSRQTGQTDVIVGVPATGRRLKDLENLIGFFVNTLALRTDISSDLSFRQVLGRVRETTLQAQAHSDLPFEKLVEVLQPERLPNRHPIFEVTFNFLAQSESILTLPRLTLSYPKLTEPEARFVMTLQVREQRDGLTLELVYQRALFSQERIGHLLRQYEGLLQQAADFPDSSVDSYSLVTEHSRALLPDPSREIPQPHHELAHKQFLAQARIRPHDIAVTQGGKTWTYRELALRAESITHELLAAGQNRGEVVAILGPRSFGLIGGMLAVLMSGGVMLPVDPVLPVKRQNLMLRNASVKRAIYVGNIPQELRSEFSDLSIINVDPATGRVVNPTQRDLIAPPELLPDDPAYIFFTSGSTGVPKGVLGCHKGLSHFLDWEREEFGIGPEDRVAQFSLLSFDAVLRDVFLPLTSGATLCLPPDTVEHPLFWLEREAVTCLHTVPSVARAWLNDVPVGVSLRSLRNLFLSGEPLHASVVRGWRKAFPESGQIVNFYGPTETTMIKCFYRVPDDPAPLIQPAGFPLPQTQALVLGGENRLCGIGEVGEIVLRTPFGTLGYINATAEDQRRFVVNPCSRDPHDVLYRTGDLGRYRLDGSLDILGRLDQQIKVRGVRIEPAEVEAVLVSHPAVGEAIVIANESPSEEKTLVAYMVAKRGVATLPEAESIREFLRERLPESMIPSAFVSLEAMPLLPNGKVNRKALPAPEKKRAEYVAPRTVTEEALAGIWENLLEIEQFGVHDNFFDLGGHSLLATRVVSRVRETFGVDLTVSRVFQHPTVAGLAQVVEQLQVEQIGEQPMAELLRTVNELSDEEVEYMLRKQGDL